MPQREITFDGVNVFSIIHRPLPARLPTTHSYTQLYQVCHVCEPGFVNYHEMHLLRLIHGKFLANYSCNQAGVQIMMMPIIASPALACCLAYRLQVEYLSDFVDGDRARCGAQADDRRKVLHTPM